MVEGTPGKARQSLAARVDDALGDLFAARARRRGFVTSVVGYTGYGSQRWVRVLARVLLVAPPGHDLFHHQSEGPVRGWRHFFDAKVPDEVVHIEVHGHRFQARTDRGGLVDTVIPVELPTGWNTLSIRTADSDPVLARIRVIGDDETFGIISDVDDTVMVTSLPRPLLAAWNSFVVDEHARAPTPGMAVLYERIRREHDTGAPVLYLSTGAWNVAPTLTRFLERNLYPSGPLLLTDWGPTPDRFFRSGRVHKVQNLTRLAHEFPHMRWMLIGDDGQHDEAIYGEFATRFPQNVDTIVIRQLTTTEAVLAGGRARANPWERRTEAPWVYGPNGSTLASRLRLRNDWSSLDGTPVSAEPTIEVEDGE